MVLPEGEQMVLVPGLLIFMVIVGLLAFYAGVMAWNGEHSRQLYVLVFASMVVAGFGAVMVLVGVVPN